MLRRHKQTPAIICIQRKVDKIIPTEKDIIKTNRDGMGNKVGTITNRVTAMMEVQSHFKPESKEYKELEYRIACGQLYQQNEIDRLKGIVAKPMPKYWYDYKACNNDSFQQSICVAKKPYFMTYIYDDYRKKYKNYIEQARKDARREKGKNIEDIELTENDKFLEYYYAKFPFGMGQCAMNRICWYIEYTFKGLQTKLKHENKFNYKFLRKGVDQHSENIDAIQKLCFEYVEMLRKIKQNGYSLGTMKNISIANRDQMRKFFRNEVVNICPDSDERTDIILDICYKHGYNKQFMWDCAGKEIVKRLEKMTYDNI